MTAPAGAKLSTPGQLWPGPEGIAGFVNGIDLRRVEEVRLADSWRNGIEVHLKPGAGDLDFAGMFRRIEGKGSVGHYMNAFGWAKDMLTGRDGLGRIAARIGVT